MNSSLLTVEKADGFEVGMICVCVSAPDYFTAVRPDDIVKVLSPASDDFIHEPGDPMDGQPIYAHMIENLSRPLSDGSDGCWVYVNMLRPATPEEIAAL